jgi:hypothetical protein
MRTSDTLTKIASAIVDAQADMPHVPKETKGQVGTAIRFYADLATVVETVRPILAKHRLGYVQTPTDGTGGIVTVTTRLLHESGEWIEDSLSMPTGGNGAQGVGSALTYARRYSLMAVLGLAPDDDDGAAASAPAPKRKAAARPPADESNPFDDVRPDPTEPTEAQIAKLAIELKRLGIVERSARLARLSDEVGRALASSKDMTRSEASAAIDTLTKEPTP